MLQFYIFEIKEIGQFIGKYRVGVFSYVVFYCFLGVYSLCFVSFGCIGFYKYVCF